MLFPFPRVKGVGWCQLIKLYWPHVENERHQEYVITK